MQKLDENKENGDILRLKPQVVVAKVHENNIDCPIIRKRKEKRFTCEFIIVKGRVTIYKFS